MDSLKFFLFVVAYIVSSSLAVTDGEDAVEGQFKYQAYISKKNQELEPICGGVILNGWYILTSAFCVYDFVSTPDKITAFFGTIHIRLDTQKGEIAEIKIPPGYDGNIFDGSVALLEMKNRIDVSHNVCPVKLPANSIFEGDTPIFSGFGCDSVRYLSNFVKIIQTIIEYPFRHLHMVVNLMNIPIN